MRQISSALMLASLARTALSYGVPRLKKRLKTHPFRDRWGVWGNRRLLARHQVQQAPVSELRVYVLKRFIVMKKRFIIVKTYAY